MRNNERNRPGRPTARDKAKRSLSASAKLDERYLGLSDLIDSWLIGELPYDFFVDGLAYLFSAPDILAAIHQDEAKADSTPQESVLDIATRLERVTNAQGAIETQQAALAATAAKLRATLITAEVQGRMMPAYVVEFAHRLQKEGIGRPHLRDISRAKLQAIVEILHLPDSNDDELSAEEYEYGAVPDVAERPDALEAPVSANSDHPLWDELDTSGLHYDIIERDVVSDADHEAVTMKLPPVADFRQLDHADRTDESVTASMGEYGIFSTMEGNFLPEWSRLSGVHLSPEERRLWSFLLFALRWPERIIDLDPHYHFEGLLLPKPGDPSKVRQVIRKEARLSRWQSPNG